VSVALFIPLHVVITIHKIMYNCKIFLSHLIEIYLTVILPSTRKSYQNVASISNLSDSK